MNRPLTNAAMTNRPPHRSTVAAPTEQPGSALAREMRRRWHAGDRLPAEAFIAREPATATQPEAAVELIYEEFCLRDAAGDPNAEQDVLARFPQWAGQLRVMFDCHRSLLEEQRQRPRFPSVGERVGDFTLTSELARGLRGRVFLAAQATLGDRPVVLKITPLDGGGEHVSLARLQHTNVVPLYSAADDPVRRIRLLCMPYFGRATLATTLESMKHLPPIARTGADVVRAIDEAQDASSPAIASAARQMLANVSYAQAMCWIAASLADALQFAHERGVLHLDLKPSNILLAGDGQPMLLDFHLARGPLQPGDGPPDDIGGTPPYMPPEQASAMHALHEGQVIKSPVDWRADLYALGAVLYEASGGTLPIAPTSPLLSVVNRSITPGLADIVAKCIADRPEDRYADARTLADDLRRYLTDQPLAGVPNRSVVERWHKWRRRQPRAGPVAAASLALALLVAGGLLFVRDRREQAMAALAQGQRALAESDDPGAALADFERGAASLHGVPFSTDLRRQLSEHLLTANRILLASRLHRLADQVRPLYGVEVFAPARARALAAQCEALWRERGRLTDSTDVADLTELAIFAAHASADEDAARLLNEVESQFGKSAVIDQERLRRKFPATTGADSPRAASTVWEHYALGRTLLDAGDFSGAAEELAAAVALAPSDRWANFYYGLCAYRTNRPAEAVTAFSVCIGGAPDVPGCYYNRALAFAALGRPGQALDDYNRALALDGSFVPALLNRAMLLADQHRTAEAITDLDLAMGHGADAATVHYNLALVYFAVNNRVAALEHARRSLRAKPSHQHAARLRDSLQQALRDPG